MSEDVLVRVEGVSKKFCRDLKKSLWYGVKDIAAEALGRSSGHDRLRPDEFWAVDDVSFELHRGECLGLIGHNGAGKTTLLKMLNGLIKPDKGRIEMRGRVGALIALGAGFNPILTGRENIYVNGAVLGLSKREIDDKLEEIIEFADIPGFIDAPVQSYSSGMQVRLGFAVAAMCQPDVLLLDEVLAVGDIAFQAKCLNALSRFREQGTAFILISHNMHMVSRHSTKVMRLQKGRGTRYDNTDEGIVSFIKSMPVDEGPGEFQGAPFSQVYGSGKVRITGVSFVDKTNCPVTQIGTGEPVTMRVNYECSAAEIEHPLIDVVIRDREGVFFQGTNLAHGHPLENLKGCGSIDVSFASLPANTPHLLFYLAILNGRTKEVYDWKRNIPLGVSGVSSCQGRVRLQCAWSLRG
jgi:lipopolysaccharide transport system ATP-binding protein